MFYLTYFQHWRLANVLQRNLMCDSSYYFSHLFFNYFYVYIAILLACLCLCCYSSSVGLIQNYFDSGQCSVGC